MKRFVFFLCIGITFPYTGYCEVYKCQLPTGKIVYQSDPCQGQAKTEQVVKVKEMSPEEIEAAKSRLQTWQSQQAAEDAAKAEAEKRQQEELQKQENLELQRRSVEAQEQQAISAQQQLQQQQQQVGNRWYGGGFYQPYNPHGPGYGPGYYPHAPGYGPGSHQGYGSGYNPYPDPHKPQQIPPVYKPRRN
jgi:hypothetical protein